MNNCLKIPSLSCPRPIFTRFWFAFSFGPFPSDVAVVVENIQVLHIRLNVDYICQHGSHTVPLCRMEEMVPRIVDVSIQKMMGRTCQQIHEGFRVENVGIIMHGSRPTRLSFGQDGAR